MKMQTLALLAGVSAPLILGGPASGGFVGIETASKPNEFGIFTVNVYAVFDRPDPGDGSGDHMVGVAGTPDAPLNIQVLNGTFYNNPFGGDRAPHNSAAFPSLAYDTFVTVGKKTDNGDTLTITPGFPIGISGSSLSTTNSGWAVIPTFAQADPFDAANSFPGNGHILIGQFSTADSGRLEGTFLLEYIGNGVPQQAYLGFCHDVLEGGCPVCPGDCGNFDSNVGFVDFLALLDGWGFVGSACDLDGGGVGITDFLELLANWGPCLQQPTGACCLPGDICEQRTLQSCKANGGTWQLAATSCDDFNGESNICTAVCPWDCNSDGNVGISDFLDFLQQWGEQGSSCDLGLGDPGVGINDFLSLLANWGPCP